MSRRSIVCATRHGRLAYRHPARNAKETPWPPTPYPAGSAAWHAYWNAYVREAGRKGPRP